MGNLSPLRSVAEARGLCLHLFETCLLARALHLAPNPLNTETAAGESMGLRTPATTRTHPVFGQGCLGPGFVPVEVPGTRPPGPNCSTPVAWPASTHQCQLLTLVASARSSTIQRGSPSPHLAIGFPIAPSPGPEQPQQPPQYCLAPGAPSPGPEQPQQPPQHRLLPATRQRLETTRSGRRTFWLAFPSTPRPLPALTSGSS